MCVNYQTVKNEMCVGMCVFKTVQSSFIRFQTEGKGKRKRGSHRSQGKIGEGQERMGGEEE